MRRLLLWLFSCRSECIAEHFFTLCLSGCKQPRLRCQGPAWARIRLLARQRLRAQLRILHFFKTYFPDSYGGTEQFIYQLARGCALRGVDVDVLSLSPEVTSESGRLENHSVHRVRTTFEIASTGFSFRAFPRFAALAREADIVHYHYPWPFADVVHFMTPFSKPTVLTYHSDIIRQKRLLKLYEPLMNRFLGSVDRIVATSQNYLQTSDVIRHYQHKTMIIPIGLDPSTYPAPDDALLAKWRSEFGERFFLFVARCVTTKGFIPYSTPSAVRAIRW